MKLGRVQAGKDKLWKDSGVQLWQLGWIWWSQRHCNLTLFPCFRCIILLFTLRLSQREIVADVTHFQSGATKPRTPFGRQMNLQTDGSASQTSRIVFYVHAPSQRSHVVDAQRRFGFELRLLLCCRAAWRAAYVDLSSLCLKTETWSSATRCSSSSHCFSLRRLFTVPFSLGP